MDRLPDISDDQDRRYYAIPVKPQVFINLVPDHVIVHRMFPVAADRTLVECDWLYLPSALSASHDFARSVELFARVNRQDFDACERCQPGMSSRVCARGGVLAPSEHHIRAFHDWVQTQLMPEHPGGVDRTTHLEAVRVHGNLATAAAVDALHGEVHQLRRHDIGEVAVVGDRGVQLLRERVQCEAGAVLPLV